MVALESDFEEPERREVVLLVVLIPRLMPAAVARVDFQQANLIHPEKWIQNKEFQNLSKYFDARINKPDGNGDSIDLALRQTAPHVAAQPDGLHRDLSARTDLHCALEWHVADERRRHFALKWTNLQNFYKKCNSEIILQNCDPLIKMY